MITKPEPRQSSASRKATGSCWLTGTAGTGGVMLRGMGLLSVFRRITSSYVDDDLSCMAVCI